MIHLTCQGVTRGLAALYGKETACNIQILLENSSFFWEIMQKFKKKFMWNLKFLTNIRALDKPCTKIHKMIQRTSKGIEVAFLNT